MQKGKLQLHILLQWSFSSVQVWYMPTLAFGSIKLCGGLIVKNIYILPKAVWNTSMWPEPVGIQKPLPCSGAPQHQDLQPWGTANLCQYFNPVQEELLELWPCKPLLQETFKGNISPIMEEPSLQFWITSLAEAVQNDSGRERGTAMRRWQLRMIWRGFRKPFPEKKWNLFSLARLPCPTFFIHHEPKETRILTLKLLAICSAL